MVFDSKDVWERADVDPAYFSISSHSLKLEHYIDVEGKYAIHNYSISAGKM